MAKAKKKDYKKYPLYGEKLKPATTYADKPSTSGLHYGSPVAKKTKKR